MYRIKTYSLIYVAIYCFVSYPTTVSGEKNTAIEHHTAETGQDGKDEVNEKSPPRSLLGEFRFSYKNENLTIFYTPQVERRFPTEKLVMRFRLFTSDGEPAGVSIFFQVALKHHRVDPAMLLPAGKEIKFKEFCPLLDLPGNIDLPYSFMVDMVFVDQQVEIVQSSNPIIIQRRVPPFPQSEIADGLVLKVKPTELESDGRDDIPPGRLPRK